MKKLKLTVKTDNLTETEKYPQLKSHCRSGLMKCDFGPASSVDTGTPLWLC